MDPPPDIRIYLKIDEDLLRKLPEAKRTALAKGLLWILRDMELRPWKFKEEFPFKSLSDYLDNTDRSHYFAFCPYCNRFFLLSMAKVRSDDISPYICVTCGESGPYSKFMLGLKRASECYAVIAKCEALCLEPRQERILLEQSLVMIATCVEVFLRDVYAATLNMRYVSRGKSLVKRFYADSRNDFSNIDRAFGVIKKELEVDLRKTLNEETVGLLTLLFAKRNAVVHNNGYADDSFIALVSSGPTRFMLKKMDQSPEVKEPIPLNESEVESYFRAADELYGALNLRFNEEFGKTQVDELVSYIENHESVKKYL